MIACPPTEPAPISCHTLLAPALPLPSVRCSVIRSWGRPPEAPGASGAGLVEESQRWASRAGAPQNGRASSVISRFMRAAMEKRLLVLSALSTTWEPR